MEKYERLRHRRTWWVEESPRGSERSPHERASSKHLLLVCPGGAVLPRAPASALWRALLFTDAEWGAGACRGRPFLT